MRIFDDLKITNVEPIDAEPIEPELNEDEKDIVDIEPITKTEDDDETIEDEDKEELTIEEKEERGYQRIKKLMEMISGFVGIGTTHSRLAPILAPKDYRTSANLKSGQIEALKAMLVFASISPHECECLIDYVENTCLFSLSDSGFGIEKGIELAKAFSDVKSTISGLITPEKPTEGMKDKE